MLGLLKIKNDLDITIQFAFPSSSSALESKRKTSALSSYNYKEYIVF